MEDVERKLDIGVGTLKEIKKDTESLIGGQDKMISILKSNQKEQKTVIGLLEKIAEK